MSEPALAIEGTFQDGPRSCDARLTFYSGFYREGRGGREGWEAEG